MLELVGWNLGVGPWAALLLVLGAMGFAMLLQYVGEVVVRYEWSLTALGALVGGWTGSELLPGSMALGIEWDGMAVLPAIVGGLLVGGIVELAARWGTGGTFVHHHGPI